MEEALWDAYRRSDKTAVTEKLLRRSLVRFAPKTGEAQPKTGNFLPSAS